MKDDEALYIDVLDSPSCLDLKVLGGSNLSSFSDLYREDLLLHDNARARIPIM